MKRQWTVLVRYLTISTMLTVIKHVVDDNIICLSATQLMHAAFHGARNSSTAAAQNSQLYFFCAMAPNRPELNSTEYKF